MKSAICEYCNKSFKISGISRHRKACANRSTNQIAMPQNPEYDKLLEKVEQLEAERSEVIRRIKSILKASTVHDKISIIEELEQLLNSLKTK